MSVKIHEKDIPVFVDPCIVQQQRPGQKTTDSQTKVDPDEMRLALIKEIESWVPFADWAHSLDEDFDVSRIDIQSLDRFGSRIGFLKIKAAIVSKSTGKRVPGILFMRGGSVAIFPVLYVEGDTSPMVLLTRQPRPGSCSSHFLEIPAGMMDGEGNFAGGAARELEEETGIIIESKDLIDMNKLACREDELASSHHHGILLTPGGSDEFIHIFLYRAAYPRATLAPLLEATHGVESEHITIELVPLDELPLHTQDAKALCGFALYKWLQSTGKISSETPQMK